MTFHVYEIVFIIFAVLVIAASAIGIQCINDTQKTTKDYKANNKNYLLGMLASSIFVILASMFFMFKKSSYANTVPV